jgi:hypothetical protein
MILGKTVFSGPTGAAQVYYTPWFSAGGNYGTFNLEILNNNGNTEVQLEVQTKNSEDADKAGALADNSWTNATLWSTVGIYSYAAGVTLSAEGSTDHGLLELVRFKITVTGIEGAEGLANIRMLAPSFQTH